MVVKLLQNAKLWTFPFAKRVNRVMSYKEQRIIGFNFANVSFFYKTILLYTPEQMFNVVFTVDEYPKFVPWCKQARVEKISNRVLEAKLWIGFPPLNENYSSRVTALYPNVIHSVCTDGRLFHMLDTTWRFGPASLESPKNSCMLLFSLEFEFKSVVYAKLSNIFFNQVVRKMVYAFLYRAEHIYGPPSLDHFKKSAKILTPKS